MNGNQKNEEGKEAWPQIQQEEEEAPDLAMTLQAMSLSEPSLCMVQTKQMVQQQELDFSFCLIMKVACTDGTLRNISQQTLQQSLTRAWRSKFYAMSQVSNTIFMAHFRSHEDMVSVYIRQPWAVGSDNLLVEWFDPNDNTNSSTDYRLDHIMIIIRAYGIPMNRGSISLLADILNQVG
jgi:hypothetical protein